MTEEPKVLVVDDDSTDHIVRKQLAQRLVEQGVVLANRDTTPVEHVYRKHGFDTWTGSDGLHRSRRRGRVVSECELTGCSVQTDSRGGYCCVAHCRIGQRALKKRRHIRAFIRSEYRGTREPWDLFLYVTYKGLIVGSLTEHGHSMNWHPKRASVVTVTKQLAESGEYKEIRLKEIRPIIERIRRYEAEQV